MTSEPAKGKSDRDTLEQLNKEYIEAYMSANVAWYEKQLAGDFVCIESDGSVLNKAQFLRKAAEGPDVAEYRLQKVNVRIYGIVALVQATGLFKRKDQSSGVSRYTDIYVQTPGGWKVVSAQITRTPQLDVVEDDN